MLHDTVFLIYFSYPSLPPPPHPHFLADVFKHDPEFVENEEKYKAIRREILDEGSEDSESGSGGSSSEDESDEEERGKN